MAQRLADMLGHYGIEKVGGDYKFGIPHNFDSVDYCGFCNLLSKLDSDGKLELDPGQRIMAEHREWGYEFEFDDNKVASDFFGHDMHFALASVKALYQAAEDQLSPEGLYLAMKGINRAEDSFHKLQNFISNPYDEKNVEALNQMRVSRHLTYLSFEFPDNAGNLIKMFADRKDYVELMDGYAAEEDYENAAEAREEISKIELGIDAITALNPERFVENLIKQAFAKD